MIETPYLLLCDHHLQRADELLPIMEQIQRLGRRSFVVIATEIAIIALQPVGDQQNPWRNGDAGNQNPWPGFGKE